jgi:hypothetical protein
MKSSNTSEGNEKKPRGRSIIIAVNILLSIVNLSLLCLLVYGVTQLPSVDTQVKSPIKNVDLLRLSDDPYGIADAFVKKDYYERWSSLPVEQKVDIYHRVRIAYQYRANWFPLDLLFMNCTYQDCDVIADIVKNDIAGDKYVEMGMDVHLWLVAARATKLKSQESIERILTILGTAPDEVRVIPVRLIGQYTKDILNGVKTRSQGDAGQISRENR